MTRCAGRILSSFFVSVFFQVETLITEGQALLDRGYGEVKNFSKEQVLQWTSATLRQDGVKAETIQKAVGIMQREEVNGIFLLQLTAASLQSWGMPGGPATGLASRIQSLPAKKAARQSRKLVSFFQTKACPNILLFVFVPCMH